MYTQCPHCLTLFRINSEQLKTASGKVRCCQCDQTFNALNNLRESPARIQSPHPATPAETAAAEHAAALPGVEAPGADTSHLASAPTKDSVLTAGKTDSELIEDSENPLILEQNDGLETEPDYFTGSESQMSELLDKNSSSLLSSKDDAKDVNDRPPSAAYPSDKMFEKEPANYTGIAWGMASLLLFCLFAVQLIWHNRDLVIQYPVGQQLLTQMSEITGLDLPQRRDTSKITIEHRDLRIHPDKPNVLIMQLNMINRAAFDQPLPRLRLSLFDKREKLINERTFKPTEYLPGYTQRDGLMHSSEPVNITLELMDPGKDVTGFKFEFL
ncbi:MAG: DUF3426 domain-containing protein [Pseudomonadota bacterium]